MNSILSSSQRDYVSSKIIAQLDMMFEKVITVIDNAVAEIREDFDRNSIPFEGHLAANSGYFTIVLHERIFDKIHCGDINLAKLIIEMAAKRSGLEISFKVNSTDT